MGTPAWLSGYEELVERALKGALGQQSFPLYRLMEYQLGWRDEHGAAQERAAPRLYGALCLLACGGLGGPAERAVPAAVALELVYQFLQAHADLQEGSQERYQRPTLWWVSGPAQAINVGDGLHTLARLALMRLTEQGVPEHQVVRSLQTLDAACLRTCEGVHQGLVYQERLDISPDQYERTARASTGALVGCALELGAQAAEAPAGTGETLRAAGEDLGVAFQVQEDIQGLWGAPLSGKPRGSETLVKKKGYPVVYALEHAPLAQKRELGALFFKRVLEPVDLERLTALLEGLGARAAAQLAAEEHLRRALLRLEGIFVVEDCRRDLERTGRWLALRDN